MGMMTKLYKEDLIHEKDKLELYNTNPRVNNKNDKKDCVIINGQIQEDYCYELLQGCMKERERDINNNNNNISCGGAFNYNKENEKEEKSGVSKKTKGENLPENESEMELLNGLNEDVIKLSNGFIPLSPFNCNIRLYTKKSIKSADECQQWGLECDGHDHKCNKIRDDDADFDPKQHIKVIKTQCEPIKSFNDQVRNSLGDEIDRKVLNRDNTNQIQSKSDSIPTVGYKQGHSAALQDIYQQGEAVRRTKQSHISVKLKRSKSDVGRKTPTLVDHRNDTQDNGRHSDAEDDDFLNKRLHIRRKFFDNLYRSHNDIAQKEKENDVVRYAQNISNSNNNCGGHNGYAKRNVNSYYHYVHDKIAKAKEEEVDQIDANPHHAVHRKQNYIPDYSLDYKNLNKPPKSNLSRSKSAVGAEEFNPPPRLRFKEDSSIPALSLESPDLLDDRRTMLDNEFPNSIPNCSTYDYKNGQYVYNIDLKKQVSSIRSRYKSEHETNRDARENDTKHTDEVFIDTDLDSNDDKRGYGNERKGSLPSPRESRYRALSNTGEDYDAYLRSMKLYKLNPNISDDDVRVKKIHCKFGETSYKERGVPRTVDFIDVGNEDNYRYEGDNLTKRTCFSYSSYPNSGHTSDSEGYKEDVHHSVDFKEIKNTIGRQLSGKFTESYPYRPREHRHSEKRTSASASDDGDESATTTEVHHHYYTKEMDDSINEILNTIDDRKDGEGNNVLRNLLFTDFNKNSSGDNDQKSSNYYGDKRSDSHVALPNGDKHRYSSYRDNHSDACGYKRSNANMSNPNGNKPGNSYYGDNHSDAYEDYIASNSNRPRPTKKLSENVHSKTYEVTASSSYGDNKPSTKPENGHSNPYEITASSNSYGDNKHSGNKQQSYSHEERQTNNIKKKNKTDGKLSKPEGRDVNFHAKNDDNNEPDREIHIPEIFIRRKSLDRKYNEFNTTVDSLNTSIEEFITSLNK